MKKRIGILMGKVYKEVNRQQLCGILEEGYARRISAYVFTLTEESNLRDVNTGEENLFNVIRFSELDGILYFPYTFSSEEYNDYIERFLQENCPLPVVRVGMEQRPFVPVWFHDRAEMAEITRHLIKVHECRHILCLTGPEMQDVSHARLSGWKDAMNEAGLVWSESDIVFGDFWVYAARELAQEIADGSRKRPDAVVCANDTMAISLCDALAEHGLSVPNDIRVTGYDGTMESEIHVPAVTTYRTSWKQLGRNAMCLLYELITKERVSPHKNENGTLLCRASCGCKAPRREEGKEFNYQQMEDNYLDNNLSTRLLSCKTLDTFVRTMYNSMFIFFEPEYVEREVFSLCLCEDWDAGGENHAYRTHGYSPRMIEMSYKGAHMPFPVEQMVPTYFLHMQEPSVTFFTAVHFQDRCFGYALLRYNGIVDGFNAHYLLFCREVNNALEFLRVQNELKSLAYRNLLTQMRDMMTGLYNLRSLPQLWDDYIKTARTTGDRRFWIAISVMGLYQLTESLGSLEKDKLIVALAEQLQNACSHGEKCLCAGEGDFLILGSEPPTSRYHNLLVQNIREQFEQSCTEQEQKMLHIQHAIALEEQMPLSADASEGAAMELLHKAKAAQPSYSEQLHYADLAELRRNIYKHPERDWTLASCAEQMRISSSYFHRIYQKAFGVSCAADIHRSKLEHAKWLLLHTSDTLQEVARKCGYDYSHFMRTFKKEFGLTPTEYRRGKAE